MTKLRVALFLALLLACMALPPANGVDSSDSHPSVSSHLSLLTPDGFTALLPPDTSESESIEEEEEDEDDEDEWLEDIIANAEDLISRRSDYRSAIRKLRLAAVMGHEGAMFTIGALLLAGDGNLKRDIEGGIEAIKKAASMGQPDANALLGMLYVSGYVADFDVPKDVARGLVHWKIAAGSGNVYASCALGFAYRYGIGVVSDCKQSARYYKRAAEAIALDERYWPSAKNFMYGAVPLAKTLVTVGRTRLLEEERRGGESDWYYFYRHSAEMGNAESMTLIGSLLMNGGMGQEADPRGGRAFIERAVERGYGEAHGLMAHLKMREGNMTGAAMHFRFAAAYMEKNGHYGLGMGHYYGILGIERDLKKAEMHFKLAAEGGHGEGAFMLGWMHWKGEAKGGLEEAEKWFKMGEGHGNMQSLLHLGLIELNRGRCERAVELFKKVGEEGNWGSVFELGWEKWINGDFWGAGYRYLQAGIAGIELGQYNAGIVLLKEKGKRELAMEMFEWSGRQGEGESFIKGGDVAFEDGKVERAKWMYEMGGRANRSEGWFNLGMMMAKEGDRSEVLRFLDLAGMGEGYVASLLAGGGVRVWWWGCDIWSGWKDESEDLAVVGGLVVLLVGVLVVRNKRMQRERFEN